MEVAAGGDAAPHISADALRRAIRVVEWFKGEARRVYGMLGESRTESESRQLVELIERKDGSLSASELVRLRRRYSTVVEAEAALDELTHDGIGRWELPPQKGRGGPRARRLVLIDNAVNVYGNTPGASASANTVDVDSVAAERISIVGPDSKRSAVAAGQEDHGCDQPEAESTQAVEAKAVVREPVKAGAQ